MLTFICKNGQGLIVADEYAIGDVDNDGFIICK